MSFTKNALILALLVSFQTLSMSQTVYNDSSIVQRLPLFTDSFENNNNEWITDNSWISGNFSDGIYKIVCKNYKDNTGLTYKVVDLGPDKDFEIETAFKINKGTGALVFGLTKEFEHLRVEFENKKNLILVKDIPAKNKVEKLFSLNVASLIKEGSFNKLTIRRIRNIYYVFINDIFVKQVNNITISGNQLGYSVGLNSDISVDYLNVSNLTMRDATEPAVLPSALNATAVITADTATLQPTDSSAVPAKLEMVPIPAVVTPAISWISPSGISTSLDTYSARIKAKILSASDLKSVFFYVNGASKGEGEIKLSPDEKGAWFVEKTISLSPGENNVYLIATNPEGSSKSDLRYFTNPQASVPEIKWGVPVTSNAIVNTELFTLEVCIKSLAELLSAKVLIDGNQVTIGKVFESSAADGCSYIWKPRIVLKEGVNSIFVIAENVAGSATSENRVVNFIRGAAEKRLALVMGNSDYMNGTSLKNPVNDANLMEATLKELNFDVIKITNSGKAEMERAILEFSQKLPEYNVALFYFAGHGIQVDGTNYLIPTDAKLLEKVACKWEAISVTDVVSEFEKYPDNINIVILDACRNNPYRSWVRGGEAGFRFISDVSGTIIAYATAEGATAVDGKGANGLYTEELVKQMTVVQPVESVFKKTRVQVEQRSNGSQSPRESSGLRGEFYFKR